MSRKMKRYSTEFKTKIVLEVLQGDKTLNEIGSEYNIIPKYITEQINLLVKSTIS